MFVPRTILIAEDEENDAFLLQAAFKRAGLAHRLIRVHTGQEAIDYLRGDPPFDDRFRYPSADLLILDIDMPQLDGLGVLRWIATRPELQHLPVVVLTDSSPDYVLRQTQEIGAWECQRKPNDHHRLTDLVSEWDARWLQPRAAAA